MKWGMIVGGLMEWLLSRMTIKIAAPVKNWEVKFARHANSTVIKKSTGEVCPGKSHHGEICMAGKVHRCEKSDKKYR